MPEIIIIGAGISGLTAAYELKRAGNDVLVLEEAGIAGGKIGTERVKGYLLESGPNSLRVENQETRDLIESLGLGNRVIQSSPNSNKRFILKHGKWLQVPRGPLDAITTPLFSLAGKLRLMAEPFISKTSAQDESAASFVTRRLGAEVLSYAADPFITGIYAGDPAKLSMRHAFGSMWRTEQEYGSLIRGMFKKRKQGTVAASSKDGSSLKRIVSFPDGLSEMTGALRDRLGNSLRLHEGVIGIDRTNGTYGASSLAGSVTASQIVLALPAFTAAKLVTGFSPQLTTTLSLIDYPPVAVVYLGYRVDQFAKPPEGFGGLIPSSENRKILGVIFSSSNFPNRAPEGHLLLTVLMGGARNKAMSNWTEEEILSTAVSEVNDLFHPNGDPIFRQSRLWKRAIPQYNVGYSAILDEIERTELQNPGLHFLCNYRGGISIGSCIRNATELARRLV